MFTLWKTRMFPETASPPNLLPDLARPLLQPYCPLCGGVLIEMRGASRCGRCQFTLCLGCDGEAAGEWPGPAD
jgi:hypothetical protein